MTTGPQGPAHRAIDRMRNLIVALADLLRIRIALLSHEAAIEADRLLVAAALLLGAVASAALASMLGVFFVIAMFWDTHRFEAIGGCALALSATAWTFVVLVRRRIARGPPPFASSLAELEADISALRGGSMQ